MIGQGVADETRPIGRVPQHHWLVDHNRSEPAKGMTGRSIGEIKLLSECDEGGMDSGGASRSTCPTPID